MVFTGLPLSALQPVITRRLLEYSRQKLISKIKHDRGSRVILQAHRQETLSFSPTRRDQPAVEYLPGPRNRRSMPLAPKGKP